MLLQGGTKGGAYNSRTTEQPNREQQNSQTAERQNDIIYCQMRRVESGLLCYHEIPPAPLYERGWPVQLYYHQATNSITHVPAPFVIHSSE